MKTGTGIPRLGAWWQWVGGIGLLITVITTANPYLPEFSQKWRLIQPLNLGGEQNAAVWWSGIVLFLAGVLFYEFYCRAVDRLRLPWLLFAILMVTLSVDEVGSFHERLGGWRNVILVGLPFGVMFLYAIARLLAHPETRRAARFILAGFLCFGSVGIQEFVEHAVTWPVWSLGIRLGVEEGTELVGSFLVLCGIMERRGAQVGAAGSTLGIGALLPIIGYLRHTPVILHTGVLLHLGIGIFAQANFDDIMVRGNPGSWYPAMVFLLLSVIAIEKSMNPPAKARLFWWAVAAVFLMCSLGAVFAGMSVAANFVGLSRSLLLNFYFVYGGVAVLALIALLAGSQRSLRHLLLLATMVVVVAIELLLLAGAAMPHLTLGVFAYFAWCFFVLEPAPAKSAPADSSVTA